MRRPRRYAAALVAFAVVVPVAACTPGGDEVVDAPDPSASSGPGPEEGTGGAATALPPLAELPRRWGKPGSDTWPAPPVDTSGLADALDDPAPALLAHHVPERFTDPEGWGSEEVLLLGRDRVWRSLDLGDLGLDPSWWPGPDTYGSGALSADGTAWAGQTDTGVVLVDLAAGTSRHVALPRSHPVVRGVDWVPGEDVVSAYARAASGRAYRTFQVSRAGEVSRVAYDGSRTTFDVDGSPVLVRRTQPRELEVIRFGANGRETSRWEAPVAWPPYPLQAAIGADSMALPGRVEEGSRAGAAVWVLDERTGEPRSRLRVPAGTQVVGWSDRSTLLLLVGEQDLVAWEPGTGRSERVLTFPRSGGAYAAVTVALAG